jgi:hypothetical protein
MDGVLIAVIVLAILIGLVILFGLLWGGSQSGGNSDPTYQVNLTGSQEVPPNNSQGWAQATVNVDPSTNRIVWSPIPYQNLTGPLTAAHFHLGAAGVAGPIVRTIPVQPMAPMGYGGKSELAGGVWLPTDPEPLTPQLMQAALQGQIYINLHTPMFPDGEVRGQVA